MKRQTKPKDKPKEKPKAERNQNKVKKWVKLMWNKVI